MDIYSSNHILVLFIFLLLFIWIIYIFKVYKYSLCDNSTDSEKTNLIRSN